MEINWSDIEVAGTSTRQRQALYKFGFTKAYVKRLDAHRASRLIEAMIRFFEEHGQPRSEVGKDADVRVCARTTSGGEPAPRPAAPPAQSVPFLYGVGDAEVSVGSTPCGSRSVPIVEPAEFAEWSPVG